MKYILFIALWSYQGGEMPSITSVEFNNLQSCIVAGTEIKKNFSHYEVGSINYQCLQKG